MNWRRAAAALSLLAVLWLGGCASWPTPAADASAPTAGPAPYALRIDAPDDLRSLLGRHLDIARLIAMGDAGEVDEPEWQRLIDAAPAQARALLETEGYFAARVEARRAPPPAPDQLPLIVVAVDAGARTTVARFALEVQGDLERAAAAGDAEAVQTLADLDGSWSLPVGSTWRNEDWAAAKGRLLARLRAAGYAAATWSGTAADIDAARATARLFLVADSGPLFRFGDLRIDGLVAHDEQTVRNLAGLDPGVPLTEQRLVDYQERLQLAGLFEAATVTLDPDPAHAAAARVDVSLREAPLQVWTLAVGISANNGPRTTVEHLYRRVFGEALVSRNKVEIAELRQAWEGDLSTHPGPRQYRWVLGGAVERLETDADVVLSQRVRAGRERTNTRIERSAFVEAERSSRTTAVSEVDTTAVSGNVQGVWRRVDSVLLPTEGYTMSLQAGLGRAQGSDTTPGPFSRLYGRLTGFLPLGQAWYGQARIEAGQVFKREDLPIPDSQLFRAGGADSVRGYDYRSLGPIVDGAVAGGESLFTTSLELARPISARMPSVWGAVFVDAGNAARRFDELDPLIGVGTGVRWRSPVGPLRIDWAWSPELRQGRLHVSVAVAL
ncbi:MAG: BamA/TamA family outer membrane protein [Rubrivivax sp.]|jgi:translocation and assembly module TamA|nr:BamA/TamA family outer membrane protein [Rubrivivax sp.]